MMTQTRAFIAAKFSTALLALGLAACGTPDSGSPTEWLVDDRHYPDVLTESRAVEPPPALGGNRFLRGWFPWKHQDTPILVPQAEGAVLQIVNLSDRARTLTLENRLLGTAGDHELAVQVAGTTLPSVPLGATTEIPLPAGLPRGRIPLRLTFDKEPDPVVLQATLDTALPPGEVEIEPRSIVQAPSSVVDFARPAKAGSRLVGRFSPPAEPKPDQRFAIVFQHNDEPDQVLFEWQGGLLDRWRGDRTLSLPIPAESGFWRLRLVAEGSGPAATWHGLGLVTATSAPREPGRSTQASAPPDTPRLVVLYVLDALRADFVDLSSKPDSPTPTLARLADEGVVFKRHLSVAPNTIPSTKSLFTGQAFMTRGHWKLSADGPETLAEAFAGAGFRTAAFSGNGYISNAYGTARGFEHLADEVVFREYGGGRDAYNDNAELVQRSALEWLDGLAAEERAFVYLHTIHPHNPYDPPTPLQDRFASGIDSDFEATTRNLLDIKYNRTDVSVEDKERIAALYTGALAYNDSQIALFLGDLAARFPAEEILLIVTSDHGEELFDHGGVLHGYTLYREQLHIPLILWWPGHLGPQRIATPTDNLDLHESLRALIGVEPSAAHQGRSFWRLIGGEPPPTPADELRFAAASSVQGGIFMAQSPRFKLILAPRVGRSFGMGEGRGRGRDAEYLFDLVEDPQEMTNLAGLTALEPAWMRSRLLAWIEGGKYLELTEEEPVLDEETQERLRALGYLE